MPLIEDEQLVIRLFSDKGLQAKRFSKAEKRQSKTPDFRVFRNGLLKFFCEVKSIEEDTTCGVRNDPIFNRLTDDIHQAVSQFSAVNQDSEFPNVLVFVNHDSICIREDMKSVLTGDFVADDDSCHGIYKKFSEGRIKYEKGHIHLYCWVEQESFSTLLFNDYYPTHFNTLCELFSYDPTSIRPLNG